MAAVAALRGFAAFLVVVQGAVAQESPTSPEGGFWFWAEPGAEAGPAVVEVEEHCCCSGRIARIRTANTRQLPSGYSGDKVFEFGAGGVILKEWDVPMESWVVGIEGERLIVTQYDQAPQSFPKDVAVIAPSGEIGYRRLSRPLAAPESRPCPALDVFESSDYAWCFTLEDASTRQVREIIYEAPCT